MFDIGGPFLYIYFHTTTMSPGSGSEETKVNIQKQITAECRTTADNNPGC
jgi:hypothetical protein